MKRSAKVIALIEQRKRLGGQAFSALQTIRDLKREMQTAPGRIEELRKHIARMEELLVNGPREIERLEKAREEMWGEIRELEEEIKRAWNEGVETPRAEGLTMNKAREVLIRKLGAGDQSVVPALVEMTTMGWDAWVSKWRAVVER